MSGANDPRKWRVERISEGAREPIAHGTIAARQDADDTAIAIATKVGRIIKQGLPAAQACRWVDIATPTGRRYETQYTATAEDWFEMRAEIYAALTEDLPTALIHRTENLYVTIDRTQQKAAR